MNNGHDGKYKELWSIGVTMVNIQELWSIGVTMVNIQELWSIGVTMVNIHHEQWSRW